MCIGLVVKASNPKASSLILDTSHLLILQDSQKCNDDLAPVNNTTEIDTEYEEECDKTCQQIIGIVFVLVGEVKFVRHVRCKNMIIFFYWFSSFLVALCLYTERKF